MVKSKSKTWVVIPAFNESKRIGDTLDKVKKYSKNILVVDDGSTDNTSEIAIAKKVKVLVLSQNKGKGSALRFGCEEVINKFSAESIIVIDADGQHDPSLVPKFENKLKTKDFVFGFRNFSKEMPLVQRVGNIFLTYFTFALFGIKVKDSQSGYRGFNTSIYEKIKWNSNNYSVETEMTANVSKNKINYAEIEVPTIYLDRFKGSTPIDGIKIAFRMLKFKVFGN